MNSIMIEGKIVRLGDTLVSNKNTRKAIGIPSGRNVKVLSINREGPGGQIIITVHDRKHNDGWHSMNLDGEEKSGSGCAIRGKDLFRYFNSNRLSETVIIKGDFLFRKKNLKGKKGTLLAALPDCDESMVEFEEYVEGCSCDGLGKAGHCLVVSDNLLEFVDIKETKKGE